MTKKYLIISSLVLAFIAEAFLILIIYFNPYKITPMIPTELQSWLSAGLNLLSALSLLYAYMAIKKQEKQYSLSYEYWPCEIYQPRFSCSLFIYSGHSSYLFHDKSSAYIYDLYSWNI